MSIKLNLDDVYKIFKDESEYKFIEFCKDNKGKNSVKFKHENCGKESIVRVPYFLYGRRCQNKECVYKRSVENNKKIKLEKYGAIETFIEKYGVNNPFKSKEIQEKIKQIFIGKYGVDNPFKSNVFVKKAIETKLKNYYNEVIINFKDYLPLFNREEYKGIDKEYKWQCKKCNNEFIDNLEYNYDEQQCLPICRICNPKLAGTSKIEQEIRDWVNNYFSATQERFYEDGKYKYEIDIYIPEKNIGIELNGIYYHSEVSG